MSLIFVEDWEFYWCECGHMDLGHEDGCIECPQEVVVRDYILKSLPGCPTFLPRATDASPTPSWQMCPQKELERSKKALTAIISAKLRAQLPKMFPSRKVPKKVIHGKRIDALICDDILDATLSAVSPKAVTDWWDKRMKS